MIKYILFYLIKFKFEYFFKIRSNIDCNFSDLLKKNDVHEKSMDSAYSKNLVNYLQLLGIFHFLDLNWSPHVNNIANVQNIVTNSFFDVVSLNCLITCKII